MVYSTRRFVLCLTLCYFVLVIFCPSSNAITSLGEERANLSFFSYVCLICACLVLYFSLPLGVWEGLRFVIVHSRTPWTFLLYIYILILHIYAVKKFHLICCLSVLLMFLFYFYLHAEFCYTSICMLRIEQN